MVGYFERIGKGGCTPVRLNA